MPEAAVIHEHDADLGTETQRGSKVERVKRSKVRGIELACSIEERLVDTDHVDRSEKPARLGNVLRVARAPQSANRLGSEQRRRYTLRPPSESLLQRLRLWFGDDQLHKGGGVNVGKPGGHNALPFLGAQLCQGSGGEHRARGRSRQRHIVEQIEEVSDCRCRAPFQRELLQHSGSKGDDAGYRMAMIGDLDGLTGYDPFHHRARLLPQLSYAYRVTH